VKQRVFGAALFEERQRSADFFFRRHARGEQHRLAGRRDVLDKGKICQIGRTDLVGREIARLQEVDAAPVPGGAHRRDPARPAVVEQLAELIVRQLELDEERDDVLQALLAVARLVDDLFAVGFSQLSLLELHRVGAGLDGGVHEPLRDRQVAIVVDADLGNDVARLSRSNPAGADVEGTLSC
jgi:hypothetical protein